MWKSHIKEEKWDSGLKNELQLARRRRMLIANGPTKQRRDERVQVWPQARFQLRWRITVCRNCLDNNNLVMASECEWIYQTLFSVY